MWASRPAKSAMDDEGRRVLLYMSAMALRALGGVLAWMEVVVVRRRWGWREGEALRRRWAWDVLEGREEGNRIFIVKFGLDEKS